MNSKDGEATLLEKYLDRENPEFVKKVAAIVQQTKLKPDDPLFLIITATSTLRVMLEEAPKNLEATYTACNQSVIDKLDAFESAAVKLTEKKVASILDNLIKKTQISKLQVQLQTALPIGLIFLITLGLGLVLGATFTRWHDSQIAKDPAGKRQLTLEEANALKWAMSQEGQFAKNLIEWNDSLLNRECEEEIKTLGVTYRIGNRISVKGFCTIWVVPPSDRSFRSIREKEDR